MAAAMDMAAECPYQVWATNLHNGPWKAMTSSSGPVMESSHCASLPPRFFVSSHCYQLTLFDDWATAQLSASAAGLCCRVRGVDRPMRQH